MSKHTNSVLSVMAMNMKTKLDKYWGSLGKMNKLMFLAIMIDSWYKLKYLTFCLSNVYKADVVKDMVENVEIHLYRLYDFYKLYDNSTQGRHYTSESQQSNIININEDDHGVDGVDDESNTLWTRFKRICVGERSLEVDNDLDSYLLDKGYRS